MSWRNRLIDALDIETFFIARDEEEGRSLLLSMLKEMGFKDVDLVFAQKKGIGVRVRGRAYVARPGEKYLWLEREDKVG
ncbi:MAG: hypothetical protein J7M13_02515 [Synergistetes bacterium]|nr:hypothetical protein [Synergistota bacterium]